MGVTPIMQFAAKEYGVKYAPNSRETFRKETIHQFVEAAVAVANPDDPLRAINSPNFSYQIAPEALAALRSFGSDDWTGALATYRNLGESLAERNRQNRAMNRVPVNFTDGRTIHLSPGGQNEIVRAILEDFAPRFTPGAIPAYVGDTGEKWLHLDRQLLGELGIEVALHGKMPDVVLYFEEQRWLVLVEAVTSHGPVTPKRIRELRAVFRGCTVGLVFVTAFLDRSSFARYLGEIAWETEVWISEDADHMIHFNGERFLGPYEPRAD